MMKKVHAITIAATLFALAMTSSIAGADKKKHEEKFCSAVSALNADLAKLDAMGPNSTIHDLKSVLDQIQKDSKIAEDEAGKIGTPAAKQFMESSDQLTRETRDIPENMTVSQVRSRIEGDVQNVKQSAQALANESGCPAAVPHQGAGGGAAGSQDRNMTPG